MLEDVGILGKHGAKPTKQELAAQRWSAIYSMGNMKIRSAIVAFNTAEGWSRDVTVDIADELRTRYAETDGC